MLEDQLLKHKNEGNKDFGEKTYVLAAAKFTTGIALYQKHKELCHSDKNVLLKVTQLYTNRALAWHNNGNQDDAIKDADYVLENIDENNVKALYRRAYGL